ncbi:SRPBCC family protein [Agromyces albus]|uniref:SRPBCC family protein n=1 Tax=Agromyces albus TaxID=205332 RepID=A0A4Q2L6Y0_9MICO|nr:SRPBCC family protein [Agromyces albus]RXZ72730.1 hypothetical protein ESP51_02710 [Agromyces albus]
MATSSTLSRGRRVRALVIVAGATAALGVIVWRLLAPPATPPAYADARPDEADDGYSSVTHSVFIDAAPERVWEWSNDPDLRLEDLVRFENFPAVVGTVPITGEWRPGEREGDRRRVEFADGNSLAEEVLVDSPERFRYMIWGFTSPQRFAVQHGIAEFRYAGEGRGTRLTWEYTFLPTAEFLRPAVEWFLESTMSPMMRATLAAIRDGAEA